MALLPNTMNYMAASAVSPLNNGMDKFLSNLLQDSIQTDTIPSDSDHNGILGSSPTYIPPRTQYHDLRNDFISSNILQAICKLEDHSLSESPQTSSSAGSLSCSKCDDRLGSNRCLDCKESFCHNCLSVPSLDCCSKDHTIVPAGQISPVTLKNTFNETPKDFHCETHCETIRYYCKTCSKLVCQECTLWEHKDHVSVLIQDALSACKAKVLKSLENGKTGTKYIKQSIDVAVAISRSVERDAAQVSVKIHKAMRLFIQAIEEREKQLLEKVAKMRQLKLNELSNQMQGLRNALAGLAQTNEYLSKAIESDGMEMFLAKDKADAQIEFFANMYKSLQPKEEGFLFISPNYELITEIQKLGEVIYNVNNKVNTVNNNGASINAIPLSAPTLTDLQRTVSKVGPIMSPNKAGFPSTGSSLATGPIQNSSLLDKNIRKGVGQCIPGSTTPVIAKQSRRLTPSITFGTEGHEDGQVSRPWGLCIDREGNIIVADRRNNRIQIFGPEGAFKLKFGTKGSSPGEFDLPAGITTDSQGRIIVVDKDNHRVQIFTSLGAFILTFGMFGKNCGQFRYPWDVAVNTEGHIIITDTRNYRIQMFNSDGVFITMLLFDSMNHNRMLKGLTTPRGVCFTPVGNIIISDFENHRLLLIDSSLTGIIGSSGYEGLGIGEFSRPSGIICDDEGRIIVADSKNYRVVVYSQNLEYLWTVEVKGTGPDENDRPTDVGLTPQGQLVVIVEGSLDSREGCSPNKTFIQIF